MCVCVVEGRLLTMDMWVLCNELTEISNPESKSLDPCDPQCQDIMLSCAEIV